jgi:hypothetical protein
MSEQLKDLAKKETYTPKPITYNTNLEKLLKENSEECESLSILHRMSYEKYNTRSNYINIPVIILSSAIGFITGIDLQYDQMNIILGVGSVFVGIIKSVDTYFQLAKRAESHRICSLQFSQISKKMQVELTLHRNQRMTAENMMNIIKTDIKNMQDIAPLIDDDIINIYNAKYRKYKRVKKPNFVNGLTDVVVNSNNNEYEYEFSSRRGSREASPANQPAQNDNKLPSHDPEYELQTQQQQSQQQQSQQQSQQQQPDVKLQQQSQQPPTIYFNPDGGNMFHSSIHKDDDNRSVDPIQPTIIPTTSIKQVPVSSLNPSIRKSPSLTTTNSVNPVQPTNSQLQLLELLNQLQLQQQQQQPQQVGSGTSLPNISNQVIRSVSPAAAAAIASASDSIVVPVDIPFETVVPVDVMVTDVIPSVSPSGSVRSNSSIPLGTIQTDNSGNQIINT